MRLLQMRPDTDNASVKYGAVSGLETERGADWKRRQAPQHVMDTNSVGLLGSEAHAGESHWFSKVGGYLVLN